MTRKWEITGYDGLQVLFRYAVPYGNFTNKGIERVLKALVAKLALNESEIISSYSKSNSNIYAPLLEVQRHTRPYGFSYGTNPHVFARCIEE